jgi:4-hydroxy-tetrahydrodipicolinate synthase
MAKGRFTGLYPMLYTFFAADGGLDRAAMKKQVDVCVAAGASGIAILGIVGEFNKMNVDERRRVVEVVAEDLNGRLPLAVTVCETSVSGQIEFMRTAEAVKADWVILQPPPIKGIPEGELVRFFGAVAEKAKLPVAIQNNPVNLDVWLTDNGLKTLNRNHANVDLLKGEGPVHVVRRTVEETGGVYDIFCGLGGKELPMSMKAGCIGCVPAPDCIDVQVRILKLIGEGKHEEAERLHKDILPYLYFVLHSPEHMLCYGKRLFAKRAGIGAIHPRAPHLQPNEFSTGVIEHYARGLKPLQAA